MFAVDKNGKYLFFTVSTLRNVQKLGAEVAQ
jgi:hypothetical protein